MDGSTLTTFLFLGGFVVLHLFMHRGHGSHGGHGGHGGGCCGGGHGGHGHEGHEDLEGPETDVRTTAGAGGGAPEGERAHAARGGCH